MSTLAAIRLESIATRCQSLTYEQEATVLHRFIAKLQMLEDRIDSMSFIEISDRLEAAVAGVENEAREVEV